VNKKVENIIKKKDKIIQVLAKLLSDTGDCPDYEQENKCFHEMGGPSCPDCWLKYAIERAEEQESE